MSDPNRLHISYSAFQFADESWTGRADRWTATFYTPSAPQVGTAVITRVIPGVHPNPFEAFDVDPGLLDRIPGVLFTEDGQLTPVLRDAFGYDPSVLLLLESVEVEPEWRGKGVGMSLAVTALRRLAGAPRSVAVTYPAPIHPQHTDGEECPYESDDPEVRRPDELATVALRKAWAKHGFRPLADGVYALPLRHSA